MQTSKIACRLEGSRIFSKYSVNPFRVQAYRRAASGVRYLPQPHRGILNGKRIVGGRERECEALSRIQILTTGHGALQMMG